MHLRSPTKVVILMYGLNRGCDKMYGSFESCQSCRRIMILVRKAFVQLYIISHYLYQCRGLCLKNENYIIVDTHFDC